MTAKDLIPSPVDSVKPAFVWRPCALCGLPVCPAYEYCSSCEKIPGLDLAHKRAVIDMIADHQRRCDERRKREARALLEPSAASRAED